MPRECGPKSLTDATPSGPTLFVQMHPHVRRDLLRLRELDPGRESHQGYARPRQAHRHPESRRLEPERFEDHNEEALTELINAKRNGRTTSAKPRPKSDFKSMVWTTTSQVTCPCGAIYERTEFNAAARETDGFKCTVYGKTLELFTTKNTPSYRLISAPLQKPQMPSE
jgi:hypothetical protein